MSFALVDGEFVTEEEAEVSIFDRGFMYGEGVFETIRLYSGRPFLLDDHLERLCRSARMIGMEPPWEVEALSGMALGLIERNAVEEGVLRITVSGGFSPGGVVPSTRLAPTLIMSTSEGIRYDESDYVRGFRVRISEERRNTGSIVSRVKSLNYLPSLLALSNAYEADCDEAILLNDRGSVAEGAVSNVFLVRGGAICTPSEESGILPGITRQTVMEIAEELGTSCEKRLVDPEELFRCEEAFLTNSLVEIMPIVEIEGRPVGAGTPGELTGILLGQYRRRARSGGE